MFTCTEYSSFQFAIWFFISNLHAVYQVTYFIYLCWSKSIHWSQEGYRWINEGICHIQSGTLCSWMSSTNIVCIKWNMIQWTDTNTNYGHVVYLLRIWNVYELINTHWYPSHKLHISTDQNTLVRNMVKGYANIFIHIQYGSSIGAYSKENRQTILTEPNNGKIHMKYHESFSTSSISFERKYEKIYTYSQTLSI